ncbi:V-set and immunoglobulin domain-containing protein 8a [Trichomycterus rosablanca]|uniref:V-set and immunoglobulin domain-containing protein 8a n=1 Tax=Trichomycterus rosablanca TaxID=2290929 RepID=UPI002F35C03A
MGLTDVTSAMRLTSTGLQSLQLAQGEKAILGCTYMPDPADVGDLDIEWTLISPDTTQKDQLMISFSGGIKYFHAGQELLKGVDFLAADPSFGDASLSIESLTSAHAGTYQCKVKKSPGVDMLRISLVVMEKPSRPKCWLEGDEAVGKPVSLHCRSDQGSPPIQYVWRRESGGPIPPAVTQNPFLGELIITNHSVELAGIYACEVSNPVGKELCRLNLQAIKPPNRAGVIAGTVSGCLLLIGIILIILWLLFFRFKRRHKSFEKEFSNEIREDVPAPESRPTSRGSSRHSRLAYSQMIQTHDYQPAFSSPGSADTKYSSKYGVVV